MNVYVIFKPWLRNRYTFLLIFILHQIMKKVIKTGLGLASVVLFLASCQKEAAVSKEEGLMSATGNQELVDDDSAELIKTEVVLHKKYSKALSEEEAEALWNEELKSVKNTPGLKAYSTEWFHRVRTRTGSQTNNGTDDRVECSIYYTTDIGSYYKSRTVLNNSGNDREEGQWDYYLIRSYIADKAIRWIELDRAYLYMQGTDGWFPTDFDVYVTPYFQSIPATGGTYIYSAPNEWLDSETSTGWDSYGTGNIGYGRLTF